MVLGKSVNIVYYTANVADESFCESIRRHICAVAPGIPIVSVSQKPINFGKNICVGDIGQSHLNIYRQMLIGAKAAVSDYVIICEDDTLYAPGHFTSFLPPPDTFAYNINRWRIYSWTHPPVFSYSERPVGSQLIAPRKLLVDCLTERFEKFKNESDIPHLKYFCEPGRRERQLGVSPQKMMSFKSRGAPNIVFTTEQSLGFNHLKTKKAHGRIKKTQLPYWGSAQEVLKYYKK